MIKHLILLCSCLLIGCGGEKAEIEQSRAHQSPLRNLPIPLDQAYDESPTVDLELNPLLQDSILTLEEQEELIEMVETLLQELAHYKRLYYLQLLKK